MRTGPDRQRRRPTGVAESASPTTFSRSCRSNRRHSRSGGPRALGPHGRESAGSCRTHQRGLGRRRSSSGSENRSANWAVTRVYLSIYRQQIAVADMSPRRVTLADRGCPQGKPGRRTAIAQRRIVRLASRTQVLGPRAGDRRRAEVDPVMPPRLPPRVREPRRFRTLRSLRAASTAAASSDSSIRREDAPPPCFR
jgi:hypothetical protein